MLYPGVFPNLAALTADRADLLAILLTGIPSRDRPGLPELHRARPRPTCCGSTWRSRPPPKPNINGILGGDLAGFPNGRRVFDDVVTIELRAIAGATYPLVDPTYTPDGAAAARATSPTAYAPATSATSTTFPYLDHPVSGYDVLPLTDATA